MSNQVLFSCTTLAGSNKRGVIKPDENGYYATCVGGLNVFNSVGQLYVYEEAKELFQRSSAFMRRVKGGKLKGELGHPKPLPGMSEEQFAARCMTIDERNVSCHHKEIWLDFDSVKDDQGRPVIAIMSKVAPSGPHGEQLKRSFENPDENVCFSIRAFTDDFHDRRMGFTKRVLRTIVTWDQVTEPGIAIAEKYKSPTLESFVERSFSRGVIERAMAPSSLTVGTAMESTLLTGQELFQSMGWNIPTGERPSFLNW